MLKWRRSGWAIVAAVAGLAIFLGLHRSGETVDPEAYETLPVDRGTLVGRVTASGTLSALVTVQVGSQVSGRLSEILVDFNDTVSQGDVLARIDPQLFEAALEQARANYSAAEGQLVRAQAEAADALRQAERSTSLADQNLVARADADTARTAAEAAAAQVKVTMGQVAQARAARDQAEVNIGYTTIRSPIDGVVISRNVDVGQTVAASFQAPTLFVLAQDLARMQVHTNVAEADVGKLEPGMEAEFTVDAWPSERFPGTVRQLRNAAQVVQNVVTYDAVIDVDNPEGKLRPGMTANVGFIFDRREDVLRVPNAALRFRAPKTMTDAAKGPDDQDAGAQKDGPRKAGRSSDAGEARTVWRIVDGKPDKVSIHTGLTDGSFSEVLDGGLADGDQLLIYAPGATPGQDHPSGSSNAFRRGH